MDPNLLAATIVVGCFLLSDALALYVGYTYGRLEERARKLSSHNASAENIAEMMTEIAKG